MSRRSTRPVSSICGPVPGSARIASSSRLPSGMSPAIRRKPSPSSVRRAVPVSSARPARPGTETETSGMTKLKSALAAPLVRSAVASSTRPSVSIDRSLSLVPVSSRSATRRSVPVPASSGSTRSSPMPRPRVSPSNVTSKAPSRGRVSSPMSSVAAPVRSTPASPAKRLRSSDRRAKARSVRKLASAPRTLPSPSRTMPGPVRVKASMSTGPPSRDSCSRPAMRGPSARPRSSSSVTMPRAS